MRIQFWFLQNVMNINILIVINQLEIYSNLLEFLIQDQSLTLKKLMKQE